MRVVAAIATALASPAAALPAPGLDDGAEGWRFAACRMESVCQAGECRTLPIPGQTFLWRDATGIRIGTSESAAAPVAAYDRLEEAVADFTAGIDWPSESFIVTPPEDEGPGWLRLQLYRVTGEIISARHFRLGCETADEAPAAVDAPPPETPGPEVPTE